MTPQQLIRDLAQALIDSNTWLHGHHNIDGQAERRVLNEAIITKANEFLHQPVVVQLRDAGDTTLD